jgi:hypothetical protein
MIAKTRLNKSKKIKQGPIDILPTFMQLLMNTKEYDHDLIHYFCPLI